MTSDYVAVPDSNYLPGNRNCVVFVFSFAFKLLEWKKSPNENFQKN